MLGAGSPLAASSRWRAAQAARAARTATAAPFGSRWRTVPKQGAWGLERTRHGPAAASLTAADAPPAVQHGTAGERHLAVLQRAVSSGLLVADGPLGRGLFTVATAEPGDMLFRVPDVCALIVPDPHTEPPPSDEELEAATASEDEGPAPWELERYGGRAHHASYLRRWQAHHALQLPEGLQALLLDAASLPAPARLALWLMWLRRVCAAAGDSHDSTRGLGFWKAYMASLPAPTDVTCLSVFSEQEAELLQVPAYVQQWRRTRDNLPTLLGAANHAAEHDACGWRYELDELRHCYALATSRCFHLPGRMLMAPFADMGNHMQLYQATAYPLWANNELYFEEEEEEEELEDRSPTRGGGGGSLQGLADGSDLVSGWFGFCAVRELPPGTEVCICYSQGDNLQQAADYGFVSQANSYDRLHLNPHMPWPLDEHLGDDARPALPLPPGASLCWPAVVAAAGFWAPRPSGGGGAEAGQDEAAAAMAAGESAATLEQALLRPRSAGGLAGRLGGPGTRPDPQRTAQLVRRRSALLSLPHTLADVAALRRSGLGAAASPAAELRAAGADVRREVETVAALQRLCEDMAAGLGTSLAHDEALWAALEGVQAGGAAGRASVEGRGARGGGGGSGGLLGWLKPPFGGGLLQRAPAAPPVSVGEAELQRYQSPRGRTALLARLEHKRVLAEAADVLRAYRQLLDSLVGR